MAITNLKCPCCKFIRLDVVDMAEDLRGGVCNGNASTAGCGGHWIVSDDYWKWLQGHPAPRGVVSPPENPDPADLPATFDDSTQAKLCAWCGRFMTRYRVGPRHGGVGFLVDRCASCGGVWLDKGEWEVLRRAGLHSLIHLICDDSWQRRVRQQEQAAAAAERLRAAIGGADFDRLKQTWDWIGPHPSAELLMSYLRERWEERRAQL